MTRKPRGDSVLKTLPEERQDAIAEHALGHKLAETVAWLRDDGIQTSSAALSEFVCWYGLRRRLERTQSTVDTLLDRLKQERPSMSPEDLFSTGQTLFAALAIETNDPKVWVGTQRLALRQQALALEDRRIRVLEQRAAQADQAEAITQSALSPDEKMARMRQVFGMA